MEKPNFKFNTVTLQIAFVTCGSCSLRRRDNPLVFPELAAAHW